MAQPTLSPKLQRLALINVCLGQFMTALDSRSVIVALPTISIYFDTSLAVVQWSRWLNYYGLSGSVLPVYTQWAQSPEVFIKAFQNSWLVIAGLTAIAVVTSVLRGADRRTRKDS